MQSTSESLGDVQPRISPGERGLDLGVVTWKSSDNLSFASCMKQFALGYLQDLQVDQVAELLRHLGFVDVTDSM